MFVLAALMIETYAKQSFTSFVTERIFEPLGMTSTSYDTVGAHEAGSLSQSFAGLNGTTRRIPLWFGADVQRLLAGAGGIVSNTIDMVKLVLFRYQFLRRTEQSGRTNGSQCCSMKGWIRLHIRGSFLDPCMMQLQRLMHWCRERVCFHPYL